MGPLQIRYILLQMFVWYFSSVAIAQNNTPNYWQCYNRVGGEWKFGRGPDGCDLDTFQNPAFVSREFKNVIFDDNLDEVSERERYMQELFAVVRDVGRTYLKRRKPEASQAEILEWMRAVYATAHQESFWSHYRKVASPDLKMMRGDYGHGHGIMQVDDRWHFAAVNKGYGAHLIFNIVYSLDEYFAAWEQAPAETCVKSETDWRARARSAYSAYNGGPSKICRWTNPNDRWARNDKNWLEKYEGQTWYDYVANPTYQSPIDVECHLNNGTHCFDRPTGPLEDLYGRVLSHSQGYECVIDQNAFHCLSSRAHSACLVEHFVADRPPAKLTKEQEGVFPVVLYDVHEFCEQAITGLAITGDIIQLTKSINLRETPGGKLLKTAQNGDTSEVYDYYIESDGTQDRYYKIDANGDIGFIYAGNKDDHDSWTKRLSSNEARGHIPRTGDDIKIVNKAGINLRDKIEGVKLTLVPQGSVVEIEKRVFRGLEGRMYLRVTHNGFNGYIYGGHLLPFTVNDWVIKVHSPEAEATIATSVNFAFPRSCPSLACGLTGQTLTRKESTHLRILAKQDGWVRVQNGFSTSAGWLPAEMVDEL